MHLKNPKSAIRYPQSEIGYGDYLRFRDLVLERSGLHFPEKKRADLEAGLLKALAESPLTPTHGSYDLDAYYNLLRDKNKPAGRAEMDRLIKALTIGETYFFRDEAQFNALASQVLPALIARKRAAAAAVGSDIQPQLRIWSAGCASGEEPYSLAMLLKELLPDIENWHILILATDINQDVLARARKALYSNWSFRETRARALRSRYFTWDPTPSTPSGTGTRSGTGTASGAGTPSGAGRHRLRDDVRRMVTFASLNLIEDGYPAIHNNTVSMDLILCRNVTIYFTQEITRQVVKRLYEALVEGGWLVVGHSEPSLEIYRAFEIRTFPDAILYQKTGQPTPWPDDWAELAGTRGTRKDDNTNVGEPPPTGYSSPETSPNDAASPRADVGATSNPFGGRLTQPRASSPAIAGEGKGRVTTKPPRSAAPEIPADVDPYEAAKVLLNKGHIEEAIDELQRKLAAVPDFAPAHSLLGRAHANLARWAEARRWCQSALKLDSLLAEAYYVLGLVHQHEDQIVPAIAMLKKAIYLERDAPLPHLNLAMLYKNAGQIKNARRACRNTIRVLEKWPPASIIPDSGGATAKHLLEATRRILNDLETET